MADNGTYTVSWLCDAAGDGNSERVKEILEANPDLVDVRLAENNEHRALHFAVMNQHRDVVRVLMEAGVSHAEGIYPHRDATGPVTMAEERGYEDIVRIIRTEDEKRKLAACGNIEISDENDALFDAVSQGEDRRTLSILDDHPELLNACHRDGGSVIYGAARHGRYALVRELLDRGADFRHLTPDGASPLDGAALDVRRRNRPVHEGCLIAAGMLLQAGCEHSLESAVALREADRVRSTADSLPERFESNDSDRDGLLQIAVSSENLEMVRLLLDLGLDPDDRHQLREYESKPYSWGQPLWTAAGESQYGVAELLLQRGADPNSSVYASGNPVSRAYNNRDDRMKGLLFRHGGILDPITAGLEGETSAAAVAFHNDSDLAEELIWAAGCGGDPSIVGMCMRAVDWDRSDPRWFRLLEQPLRQWRAGPHRKFRDCDRSVYPEIFRMILERADPNLIGRFNYRIAHTLAACGVVWGQVVMTEAERLAFAEILFDSGADLDVTDDLLKSTPLGWAVRWGKFELARLYLERGADPEAAGADWATPKAWAEKKGFVDISALLSRYTS